MAIRQTLVGLPAEDLTAIRDAAKDAIIAQTVRGVTYSIAGRSFTFPSLSEAQNLLAEANYALELLSGRRSMTVISNFNSRIRRGG